MDLTPDRDPPEDWRRIRTLDAHAGGEPLRIVTAGFPPIEGETVPAKRRYVSDRHDDLRRALMWEPRGHADMYGAIPVAPTTPDGDLGVLFTHNDGYSTMCGHGVIALVTAAIETGMLDATEDGSTVRLDTPAGRVTATADVESGGGWPRVDAVTFENVPSFVVGLDRTVEVPGYGTVTYDLAFGGAYYAYVEAAELGLGLGPEDVDALVDAGRAVKRAVAEAVELSHPTDPDLGFLYGTVFTGPPHGGADSRNVCVFADGEVDRCPTGTGVSGRLAIRDRRGELEPGDPFVVESVVGSTFTGRIAGRTAVGEHEAVVPTVEGTAHVTGRHEFLIDPTDPFREGFLLR